MQWYKRRQAIAVLLWLQSAMFGWGCIIAVSIFVSGPGHPELPNQLVVAIEEAAGVAVTALLAVFTLRGSRPALYATSVFALVSSLFGLAFAALEAIWIGPLALLYLLFYPLPHVPLGAVAIPVLILSLSVIREMQGAARASVPAQPTTSDL